MTDKETIRQDVRHKIGSLSGEERIILDAQIGTHITHLPFWEDAEIVVGYMAIDDEVDLQAILRAALRAGKGVGLPRIDEGSTNISIRIVPDFPLHLERHKLGFLQPPSDTEVIHDYSKALILVPGRAFDRLGHRLGRGGGFYDRFLGSCHNPLATVGVAYSGQLRSAIPVDAGDRPVQIVITDSETCFCSRPKKT